MSLPSTPPPHVMPSGRHGPVPPRTNSPRVHSIVAVSVIAPLGAVSAFFAFFIGVFLSDVCHGHGELACSNTYVYLMALSSPFAVVAGVVLACVGLVRARRGGGHGFAVAAWCVWGGFCAVWWLLFALSWS